MALGASLLTETAGTTAHASDINTNNANINNVVSPTFNIVNQSSGVSESGDWGMAQLVPSGMTGIGIGVGCNFKRTMLLVPSSIGVAINGSSNIGGGININSISARGFGSFVVPSGTGQSSFDATYSTNGNCLLEVHPGRDTFHHHCDRCDSLNLHIPLKELYVETAKGEEPGLVAVSYRCPVCEGRRSDEEKKRGRGIIQECFNTAHASAEEAETFAPMHPGRHLHVRTIRQVMQIIGLKVAN